MTVEQMLIFALLIIVLGLFIWGKWRYDIVALAALLVAVMLNLVPMDEAFSGFSHPAVITVAMVLIVSRGLMNSGIVDFLARKLMLVGNKTWLQLSVLVIAVTISSAFMNNVGALALFMPVAIRMARKSKRSPSLYLMPLAFGSLLGGLMTLIGTPPNIIIATYRMDINGQEAFKMFDFLPVGFFIAFIGAGFIILIARFLVPVRLKEGGTDQLFEIEDYVTEIIVPKEAKWINERLSNIEKKLDEDIMVIALLRDNERYESPRLSRKIKANDRLIIRSNADSLQQLIDISGFKLADVDKLHEEDLITDEVNILEALVTNTSDLLNRNAANLNLRSRHSINLLGIARSGGRLRAELKNIRFRSGDVLLLQGSNDALSAVVQHYQLLPLAERHLRIGRLSRVVVSLLIFAVAILLAATSILSAPVAFALAALVMVLGKFINLKEIYTSVDWPIIVLLGALLPVSNALETTGGAALIAGLIENLSTVLPTFMIIGFIVILSMMLSNIINNAAAALIMAPIAVTLAIGLNYSVDPFLMAVAIGASSAFLTPIGHQSNTLVMGPGGYHFGDYWRLGLPLSLLIIILSVPLIMFFWPL